MHVSNYKNGISNLYSFVQILHFFVQECSLYSSLDLILELVAFSIIDIVNS